MQFELKTGWNEIKPKPTHNLRIYKVTESKSLIIFWFRFKSNHIRIYLYG